MSKAQTVKTIVCVVSLALNALFIALFALAVSSRVSSISFYTMDERYFASALVISVPRDTVVVFNMAEIELRAGDQAALQLSAVSNGRQTDWLLNALFDRSILAVENTGFGILITALAPGETTMQFVTVDGVRNIARVTVVE
jgi:hypothetical protein